MPRLVLVIFVTLGACASHPDPFDSLNGSRRTSVEVETIEQQAVEAVMSAPTTFDLSAADSKAAWSRARLFFERYTAGYRIEATEHKGGLELVTLSSHGALQDSYEYRVTRRGQPGGNQFIVLCRSRNPSLESFGQQNARNLARFIREGQLEVSLLKR